MKKAISEAEQAQYKQLIHKLLAVPNQAEAGQWLKENSDRNFGDISPEESQEFVETGYAVGAVKIIAVEIADGMTTDCLVAKLPSDSKTRKRVFKWSNDRAENSDWDPDVDWGQENLFIFLG